MVESSKGRHQICIISIWAIAWRGKRKSIYADANMCWWYIELSSTTHFSPRDVARTHHNHHHQHHQQRTISSRRRQCSAIGRQPGSDGCSSNGYGSSPKPGRWRNRSRSATLTRSNNQQSCSPGRRRRGTPRWWRRTRCAFHTEDEHNQASRPLSAIQKLRMSVLDRKKKELSRSGERVFPNFTAWPLLTWKHRILVPT